MEHPKPNEKSQDKKREDKETNERETVRNLVDALRNLRKQNEILRREALRTKRIPSGRIGFTLIAVGALALTASVLETSTILAFIGLGLTFWGVLFLFARPIKFVRSTLLDSTAVSSYTTLDRMTQDLNYQGKLVYIPPYPQEAYLPEYLGGLKEMVVFISANDILTMPTIEEIAKRQFLLDNPKGICIAPPGYGLVNLFEKELRTGFTQMDIESLFSSLPTVVTKNLELAKELEMNQENNIIHIRMTNSAYKGLYSSEHGFKSIHSIGCPLASAIACALAKTTAKSVTIVKDAVSHDLRTIEVWYRIIDV